jgi:tRNA (cmo5U34)-methyltransferase
MNEFDLKAREWENNPSHWDRSESVAKYIMEMIPLRNEMNTLEYGAGTGILSFLLHDYLLGITMMDSSEEMVKVMHEKVAKSGVKNLKPLLFDLEQEDFYAQKFDLIFNQMVLHHVNNVDSIFRKFHSLLNSGGYLAIADLYSEDGSFHGPEVKVHWGFDVEDLIAKLKKEGFKSIDHKQCYVLKKVNEAGISKEYPIFLLVAKK